MRAVLQRVKEASVNADGVETGKIGQGWLVFLGIRHDDTEADLEWLCSKIPRVRAFEDADGKMNLSLLDTGGDILLISQFTLYGSLRKGTRPSFNNAASPAVAIPLYERAKALLQKETGKPPACGVFGADMQIIAHNDGPVTLVLDTQQKDF